MELAELTVRGFTEEIASASPAPGGGSAAALAGAVGAALTAMVSGLTLGRKKYEAVQELALRAQAQADALRKRLLAAMEQDTQAFLQVSAAYAMPKQTPEEKQARSSAIEQAQGLHAAAACRDAAGAQRGWSCWRAFWARRTQRQPATLASPASASAQGCRARG